MLTPPCVRAVRLPRGTPRQHPRALTALSRPLDSSSVDGIPSIPRSGPAKQPIVTTRSGPLTWWAAAICLGLTIFLVGVIFLIQFRLSLWPLPVPAGDAFWFYPIATNYNLHHVLANPFGSPISGTDLRFRWHGWIYPYVLAWLTTTLRLPLFTCDLLLVALNTGLAVLSLRAFIVPRYHSPEGLIGLALLLPTVYLYCFGMACRPELVAFPLVTAIAISTSTWLCRPSLLILSCGVSFGLLMCAQPTVGVLATLLWLSYIVAVLPAKELLLRIGGVGALSLTLFCALTQFLYPYGLGDWLSGVTAHARMLSLGSDSHFAQYFLFNLRRPLAALQIAVVIYVCFRAWRCFRAPAAKASPTVWVLLGATVAYSWFVGVRLPHTSYNVLFFVPLMMVIAVALALRFGLPIGVWLALAFLSVVALLSASRLAAEGMWSARVGTSYSQFREEILAAIPPHATVAVPDAFLVALMGENPPFTMKRIALAGETADFLIEAQANSGRCLPSRVAGFTLIEDTFAKHSLRLFGVPIVNTPKAYNFALYVRSRT